MKSDAFAQFIRKRRTALSISPVQLARKAGVNMAVVGALEGGDVRHVNVAELLKVMDSLGLQLQEDAPAAVQPDQPTLHADAPKPIPANLRIRLAQSTDIPSIAELLNACGAPSRLATHWVQNTAARCHTGWLGHVLAGLIAVEGRDVTHWIVRPEWQGRGLGRKLWLHIKAQAIAAGQRELPRLPGADAE
jgi:GNAT superfamily N-acetyltransferase